MQVAPCISWTIPRVLTMVVEASDTVVGEVIDTASSNPETVKRYRLDPWAVAYYIAGIFRNDDVIPQAFPNANHLTISDNSSVDARCLDIEPGNPTPDIAEWTRRNKLIWQKIDLLPLLYFDLSEGVAVILDLAKEGLHHGVDYLVWAARPDGVRTQVLPGSFPGWSITSDMKQFLWSPDGIDVDVSIASPNIFTAPTPPEANPPLHYGRFDIGPFSYTNLKGEERTLNERYIVELYDGARKHPAKYVYWLQQLHAWLVFLRKRVWYEAEVRSVDLTGKVDWSSYDRRWRYEQLKLRSENIQVAR